MAADALLHFHSCGVAHLWVAITDQMIQTEPCDEVAGLGEYSCTTLLCLCGQHCPICWKTAWSCVLQLCGAGPTVTACKCSLWAWAIQILSRWLFLHPYLGWRHRGINMSNYKKKRRVVAVKTKAYGPSPGPMRACPAPLAPWVRRRGAGATGRPVIHRSEATMLPSSGCLWICHCGNSIINPVSPPAAPSRPH